MTLIDTHPERFGWRYWALTPELDALRPPFYSGAALKVADKCSLTAHCPHGNNPPSPACPCGVHYVPDLDTFFAHRDVQIINLYAGLGATGPHAVTFGLGLGPILNDYRAGKDSPDSPIAMRSRSYRSLAILLPNEYASAAAVLSNKYGIAAIPDLTRDTCQYVADAFLEEFGADGWGSELFDAADTEAVVRQHKSEYHAST